MAVLAEENPFVSVNDVRWTELGHNENDSMPIGNGDLAGNVWTEQNGDLVLLVAKADAWSELGKLDKLGRIRVHFTPNPFVGTSDFKQILHLEDSSIEIRSGADSVRVWIDANRPVIHVETQLEHPATMQASLELWRTQTHPYDESSPDKGGLFGLGAPELSSKRDLLPAFSDPGFDGRRVMSLKVPGGSREASFGSLLGEASSDN